MSNDDAVEAELEAMERELAEDVIDITPPSDASPLRLLAEQYRQARMREPSAKNDDERVAYRVAVITLADALMVAVLNEEG